MIGNPCLFFIGLKKYDGFSNFFTNFFSRKEMSHKKGLFTILIRSVLMSIIFSEKRQKCFFPSVSYKAFEKTVLREDRVNSKVTNQLQTWSLLLTAFSIIRTPSSGLVFSVVAFSVPVSSVLVFIRTRSWQIRFTPRKLYSTLFQIILKSLEHAFQTFLLLSWSRFDLIFMKFLRERERPNKMLSSPKFLFFCCLILNGNRTFYLTWLNVNPKSILPILFLLAVRCLFSTS